MQERRQIAERLKAIRIKKGYASAASFANHIGMPEVTYRAYESGARPLTLDAAKAIAPHLKVDWQWLILGDSASANDQADLAAGMALARIRGSIESRYLAGEIPVVDWTVRHDTRDEAEPPSDRLDVIGILKEIPEQIWKFPPDFFASLDLDSRSAMIFYIKGDSMAPTLCRGDQVIVDTSDYSLSPPGIFAVWERTGVSFRRLDPSGATGPNYCRVISDNAKHPPIEVPITSLVVLGRAVWVGRTL